MTRKVLRGLRAVALTGTLVLASGAAFAESPIKLGVLEDQSGDFAAATGWDACTGLGTPNGAALRSVIFRPA